MSEWGWDEEKVLAHPYARIVELMEARASRLSRQEKPEVSPAHTGNDQRMLDDGTPIRYVEHVSDLSAFGVGPA